jgi:glutaredoxin
MMPTRLLAFFPASTRVRGHSHVNQPEIIMYARERYCPDVERTRARLTELGISWIEHDIEDDASAAATVEELTGRRSVPTVVIGDCVLVEPSNNELDETLLSVGYHVRELQESKR